MGIRGIPAGWNCAAGALLVLLVYPIVRLSAAEWRILVWGAVPLGAVFVPATTVYRERIIRELTGFLERHFAGEAGEEEYRRAFARLVNMPRTEAIIGQVLWMLLVPPLMVALYLLTGTFSASSGWTIGIGGVSTAMLAQVFAFVSFKRFLEPYRMLAATGIPDPEARGALVKHTGVGLKLSATIAGLIVAVTFFSVAFGQARLFSVMEARVTDGQKQLLEDAQREAAEVLGQPGRALPPQALVSHYGDAHFLIVDAQTREIVSGDSTTILREEIDAILDSGDAAGDSASFSSPTTFSWNTLPDGRHLLIVTTSREVLGIDEAERARFIVFVASLALLLGLAAARYLTVDVTRSIARLNARVAKIASGDLRRATVLELEDDLGTLERGIAGMTIALRETVAGVASSADRVESSAEAIARSATDVSRSSSVQGESIREVAVSMEEIDGKVRGIHGAAEALGTSVENSSASVQNLGAMGDGLAESGSLLIAKVNLASQAFERMFQSIARVVESTGLLSEGTHDATSGIDEMAAALSQVQANASETAKLSDAVVTSAEQGRLKVQETIDGIGSIRDDTNLLAEIVHDLGGRTDEIGSIVTVIDDVTDETNLLALNAAIIAAQAGENGRAFSVVAEEVKALADRVLASTAEITGVISRVQEGVENAVRAIRRTADSVNRGVELSAEGGTALEDITRAARESGNRMQEVVAAVREQSKAGEHMVGLMAAMKNGVEAIRAASDEENRTTEEVLASNQAMSEAAKQVQSATEDQRRSTTEISAAIERVREIAGEIGQTLTEQSLAIQTMAKLLQEVSSGTRANEGSTQRMDQAAHALLDESVALRGGVERFKI
jgi:methyl-accepting chemotaxis protein